MFFKYIEPLFPLSDASETTVQNDIYTVARVTFATKDLAGINLTPFESKINMNYKRGKLCNEAFSEGEED